MYTLLPNQDYRDQSLRENGELSAEQLQADAAKHYDDCYHDYLFAWCNTDNLALHYGYWDQDLPYDQHQALLNKANGGRIAIGRGKSRCCSGCTGGEDHSRGG